MREGGGFIATAAARNVSPQAVASAEESKLSSTMRSDKERQPVMLKFRPLVSTLAPPMARIASRCMAFWCALGVNSATCPQKAEHKSRDNGPEGPQGWP